MHKVENGVSLLLGFLPATCNLPLLLHKPKHKHRRCSLRTAGVNKLNCRNCCKKQQTLVINANPTNSNTQPSVLEYHLLPPTTSYCLLLSFYQTPLLLLAGCLRNLITVAR